MERGASTWSSNSLVEVVVKFGVLLATPRNEARKSPRNLASYLVLTGAFNANTKNIEKGNAWFKSFKVICTLLNSPFMQMGLHL